MALYELQNIQWELDPPEDNPDATYEEMLALYELPTSYIVGCDDEEGIADALSNKFGWLVQGFDIAPDLYIEQYYAYCISQSLVELCEDLKITRDQIKSAYVRWTTIYLTLKDGRELEHETYGDPSEIDYKYPEKVTMWDVGSGTTWSVKDNVVPMSEDDHEVTQKYVLLGHAPTTVLGIYKTEVDAKIAGDAWVERLGGAPASYSVTCTEEKG